MYNICSQQLQSLNSVQQKLFVLQPLKDMLQMRPPAGKVPNDPHALSLEMALMAAAYR